MKEFKSLLHSVLLLLVAIAIATAATVAWFSISDQGTVNQLALQVIGGDHLRFDLDPHQTVEEYKITLEFEEIARRMERDLGFQMEETPLMPVTTEDYNRFCFEDGEVVSEASGSYLTFTLHLMADEDMLVFLTEQNTSDEVTDGTLVSSSNPDVPRAMRISFSADGQSRLYTPQSGMDRLQLYSLQANTDFPVVVHIWLEGTDPVCTNAIRLSDYSIQLRMVGEEINESE